MRLISLLCGAAAAWLPVVARAQQGERCGASACCYRQPRTMRNFNPGSGRFLQRLAQSGWIVGANIRRNSLD
jgi:hypothetical protein